MVRMAIILLLNIFCLTFALPIAKDFGSLPQADILKNDVITQYQKIETLLARYNFDLSKLPPKDENLLHEKVEILEGKIETLKELQKTQDLVGIFKNDDVEMAIFLLDFGNLMEDFENFFDYIRITENGGYKKSPSLNDELSTMQDRINYMRTTIINLKTRLQQLLAQPTTSQQAKVFETPLKFAERFPNFAEIVIETIRFQENTEKNPTILLPLINRLEYELQKLPENENLTMRDRLEVMLNGLKKLREKLIQKLNK